MSNITIENYNGFFVLRDDLLPGGTKSILMPSIIKADKNEYVYASPVYGGFQIALSKYCSIHGKKATIFCAARNVKHSNTIECINNGANVIEVKHGYLSVVEKAAREYALKNNAYKLQFGAHTEENINIIAHRAKDVIKHLGVEPSEIWCAVGSGTILEGILKGTNRAKIKGVCVGADYENFNERVELFKYHLPFEKESKSPCPFPSMKNYDLKAWEYYLKKAPPGSLFWNVL